MRIPEMLTQFTRQAQVIRDLAANLSAEQARWKPNPASWSILEVINHLYDEERRDFRLRLDLTLHQPGADWPPIDPAGWVTAERYNERDLTESMENFLRERRQSLDWLAGLVEPDWDKFEMAPWGAPLHAGDLISAWLAHDLLHIRQLNELHYAWTARAAQPYIVLYAGDW